MKISGSGHIPSGDYNDNISISGSGKIDGNVRCVSFSCSGASSSLGDVCCSEMARVSGSSHFDRNLSAKNIHASGSISVGGSCSADEEIKISGGFKCTENVKCASLKVSGGISVGGGIEAEAINISGSINCSGLLNAEKIEIAFSNPSGKAGSIGGSDIKIYNSNKKRTIRRLPLISKLIGSDRFTVSESIEGDVIALECVEAPLVVGRIVAVGANCRIDLVQYSEEIEIDPSAKIGKYEKI